MANENSDYSRMGDQALDAERELVQEAYELEVMLKHVQGRLRVIIAGSAIKVIREMLKDTASDLEDLLEDFPVRSFWETKVDEARAGK